MVRYLRSEKRIKKLKKKVAEWQAKHELALEEKDETVVRSYV